MGSISFGGDPESFMEAPRMENKALTDVIGGGIGNPIAVLMDLVGIHRQVAKEPKADSSAEKDIKPAAPQATVPQVVTDMESVFTPRETPITPALQSAPMSSWGQRWLDSMKPLQTIDPNDGR